MREEVYSYLQGGELCYSVSHLRCVGAAGALDQEGEYLAFVDRIHALIDLVDDSEWCDGDTLTVTEQR